MTLDDIFDELNDAQNDIQLAMDISISKVDIRSIKPGRITLGLLEELASTTSGFKLIPEEFLTDELIITGMGHMRAKDSEIHATSDYKENYRCAALKRLETRELFLAAFNPDLVDKRMLIQMMATSSSGDDQFIKNVRASQIDDEVALVSLEKSITVFFNHPAASTFKESTWLTAIKKDDKYWGCMAETAPTSLMANFINQGYWPEKLVGEKPDSIKDAISRRMKEKFQGPLKTNAFDLLIKSYPVVEVLPLLKASSRIELRNKLYSTEEMKPFMQQFPFLKSSILERDLGL